MKKVKNIGWLLLGLAGLLFLNEAFSQGPPIFTDTPIMLGLEGGGVRLALYAGKIISKGLGTQLDVVNYWSL